MVETKTIAMVAVVVIISVAAYYLMQGGSGGAEVNATAFLVSAIDKAGGIDTYSIESGMSVDGSEPIYSKVMVSGLKARVDVTDGYRVPRSFFFLTEGTFACLPERNVCVSVVVDESSNRLRNMIAYAQGQIVELDAPKVREWISSGVIDVERYVGSREVAGRTCDEIVYRIYFDLMHEADLIEAGYDRRVAPYIARVVVECLDTETGFVLYRMMNNTVLGELQTFEFNVSVFEPDGAVDDSVFALVGELINETEFTAIDVEEVERKSCLLLPDEYSQVECFEEKAFNSRNTLFCSFIDSPIARDRCYMIFVPLWEDPLLCEQMESLKDDCYYEIGLGTENATACGLVSDRERVDLCATVLGGNATACLEIGLADECALTLSQKTSNTTICEQIVDEKIREVCVG